MKDMGKEKCLHCGLSFKKKRLRQKFCKTACRFKWHNERASKGKEMLKKVENAEVPAL
jgi:hypothetical protein